ncbi:SDR family NAD(P)-dependent oxidoreductase [Occallatibacter riparius]|uniref:SDR family NAD(P)-dependent oxidoreductase n=1 Tax=Occallatibacter riparius TaxID=1002689 RepID=A0A9J7BVG2_9BACT|nr:SDR family NAD(P)-dependent oxidoreductase [Occallatibacter riparius]UWZ86616.1 SDR family NAD(P)-dependent oxidoreductase [Occallatibacter riparius]
MASTDRTVLITGASSGFGLLTTITLARRGWHVLATMRDLNRRSHLEDAARGAGVLDQIEIHPLDVTHNDQIAAIASLVEQRQTSLHALINNAGFAAPGFADDVTDAELREQLDTNFFGAAAVTRAFLPQLRRQGFGRIVMVSSISGRLGFPGVGSYAAAKFALEGWTESLRYEMKPLGIQVALVEPGAFETDIWTRNAKLSARLLDPASPNAARVERWRARIEGQRKKADPQVVADTIARILDNPHPRLRYVVGADARMGLLLRKLLPAGVFERIILKNTGLDG